MKHLLTLALALALCCTTYAQTTFTFKTADRGPLLGDRHYGVFFEEINHAGEGGLYAELIRNFSFEDNGGNPDGWWNVAGGTGSIDNTKLLNPYQNRCLRLQMKAAGDGTRNEGWWGINVYPGRKYTVSFWVRSDNYTGDLRLQLQTRDGGDLGHTTVTVGDCKTWKKVETTITANAAGDGFGWFAILGNGPGTIYLDVVSLQPPTFKNRKNGCRKDLAEMVAALKPRFVRFPGGCYVEGGNRYQWKHTIGPLEERTGLHNSHWGYPVSNGMGFLEYLEFCEDLGAEPLFVVNMGIGHGWLVDYQRIDEYLQEALDAIEYANGDGTTYWGARRIADGHPEPFNLRLMEIGNENYNFQPEGTGDQSDHYAERFLTFYRVIKAKYPYMTLIGNVESWGTDRPTWRNPNPVDLVDEHYYRNPDWFAAQYHKYDNYSRTSHGVYAGEYAVTSDFGNVGTLKAALGEAIYMAGMEVNSDVCQMASYAPMFCNEGNGATQWVPDMIHFNAYQCFGTPSYWVQQMMGANVGHQNLHWTEANNTLAGGQPLYVCASINEQEDEAILKIVNYSGAKVKTVLKFDATPYGTVQTTVLSHSSNQAENTMDNPRNVYPVQGTIQLDDATEDAFNYTVPAYSLNILRVPLKDVKKPTELVGEELPEPVYTFDFEQRNASDQSGELQTELVGGARILQLSDGNKALYTGPAAENGYLDFGTETGYTLGYVMQKGTFSWSMDILLQEPSHLGSYCWALGFKNPTGTYFGIVSAANNNNWYGEMKATSAIATTSHCGLKQGQWHNICFVKNSATARFYIDGVLRSEVSNTLRFAPNKTAVQAWLGRSAYVVDSILTDAWMDDVRLYNKALTAEQVVTLWQQTQQKSAHSDELGLYSKRDALQLLIADAEALKADDGSRLKAAIAEAQSAVEAYAAKPTQPDEVLAQIEEATETLRAAYNDARAVEMGSTDGSTVVNITSLMQNPTFNKGNNGWIGTPFSAAPGTVAEQFAHPFDSYQILRNMPPGRYEMTIQGFYRNGPKEQAYQANKNGSERLHAEYYLAETGTTNEASNTFMSLYDASTTYSYYNYPDNVSEAQTAFSKRFYNNPAISITTEQTADLCLGVRMLHDNVSRNWTCFDNVRLYYCGTADGINAIAEQADRQGCGIYDLSGRRLNAEPRQGLFIKNGRKVVK